MSFNFESLLGWVEFEGPQEVVSLFEVWASVDDLVDQVLNWGDALLGEGVLDDAVVGQGDSWSVDLAETSLVDQVGDGLLGGVAVSNVWLNLSDHVDGGLVEFDEDTVVELSQSEELHDLSALRIQLIDTINL